MAMNADSGNRSGEPEVMVDINTTPLIDVMLVLLIMLIITIPIQLHSVNLDMPTENPPPPKIPPVIVQLDMDADGTILWNGQVMQDMPALEAKLKEVSDTPNQPEVHLRPDRAVKYRVVAAVMASAQRMGVTNIGFVGNEKFIE